MVFIENTTRVKAMALIRRQGGRPITQILLEQIQNPDGQLVGYRLLGGTIEFGEKSWEALEREFMEELGEDIKIKSLFDVVENIFVWADRPGHEVTFVYEAELVNKNIYSEDVIERIDISDHALQMKTAQWLDPFNLPSGLPLFPDGLIEKLKAIT